jgi:prepilin-type N-terminal cleavage/methylation domain-containing protein
MKKFNQQGLTIVEVLISVVILGIAAASLVAIQTFMSNQTQAIRDKTFASQKAMQMMEELRAYASAQGVSVLDQFSDPVSTYPTILTTDANVTVPGNPLSGNIQEPYGWRYLRHILIAPVIHNIFERQCTVDVYLASPTDPTQPSQTLAQVSAILSTTGTSFYPTQVMDMYVLGIPNVPGWWVLQSELPPTLDAMVNQIEANNPGLQIRVHWIHRLSYGRDQLYRPYINSSYTTSSAPMSYAYFYPGAVTTDSGATVDFYQPDQLDGQDWSDQYGGVLNEDGTITSNALELENNHAYAFADMFNNADRYPEEVKRYDEAVSNAKAAGQPTPDISLQMLLEEMQETPVAGQPSSFANAMLLNMHGELLAYPPLRDYSDAAKDPWEFPDERVVTQPDDLEFASGSTITLRTYAYEYPDDYGTTAAVSMTSIFFPNLTINSGDIAVSAIVGNASVTYVMQTAVPYPGSGPVSFPEYSISMGTNASGETGTLITLYDTPLSCPSGPGDGGLPQAWILDGMEYIPCQVEPPNDGVSYNLTNTSVGPKNTARWFITILPGAFSTMSNGSPATQITVDTRMGVTTTLSDGAITTDLNTGEYDDPDANPVVNLPDLSRTYFWVGVAPPVVEQYQMMGDPRDCPYRDVEQSGRYNPYFTAVPAQYTEFPMATNGWAGNTWKGITGNDIDIPRVLEMYRNALLTSQGIWSNISGWSDYYASCGGDFGSDQSPFTNSLDFFNGMPWEDNASHVAVDTIMNGNLSPIMQNKIVASSNNQWCSVPWDGELYPDYDYSEWVSEGNLPTIQAGQSAGMTTFYLADYSNQTLQATSGVTFFVNASNGMENRSVCSALGETACTSFFEGGPFGIQAISSGSTNMSNATTLALQTGTLFNVNITNPLNATRPFSYDNTLGNGNPPEWSQTTVYPHTTVTIPSPPASLGPRIFYPSENMNGQTAYGSGVLEMQYVPTTASTPETQTAYVVDNGINFAASSGSEPIVEFALIGTLRTFLDGGLYSGASHIVQVPLVSILTPEPSSEYGSSTPIVPITWSAVYNGWISGTMYTPEYPNPYTADNGVSLVYDVTYSPDESHWYYCQDGSPVTQEGDYKTTPASELLSTSSYNWNVTGLPTGVYDLRVDCYREDYYLDYAYDTIQIYISQ